jgi:hypothetical protein
MTQLSPHFALEELVATSTGIPNAPTDDVVSRLSHLANYALEPARAILAVPIKISSGYRCPALNAAVHGSDTSAHMRGDAADCEPAMDLQTAYLTLWNHPGFDYDQLIWEELAEGREGLVKWIHVGLAPAGAANRREGLIYSPKTGGKYLPFDQNLIT